MSIVKLDVELMPLFEQMSSQDNYYLTLVRRGDEGVTTMFSDLPVDVIEMILEEALNHFRQQKAEDELEDSGCTLQ